MGSGSQTKHCSPYYDCETEIIESPLRGEIPEENDDEDTLPFEDTVLLENTVPLENPVVLENVVPLETQLVGDDKNQEERSLLLRESDRFTDAEDTVNVNDLRGDTEAKTQLLEDFQLDNAISNLRNEAHLHIVDDSDDEGVGETEVLSEDDDASDGRSSPRRVDEFKHDQFPLEAIPLPNKSHAKETPETQSCNTGKGSSFNTVDSLHELEQKSIVDSDASTEDESDLGELQQHRALYPNGFEQAIDKRQNSAESIFPPKASQGNNRLDDSRALLQDLDAVKKNDSHKLTSHLPSDGLNNPEAIQSVITNRQMEMGPTPAEIIRGESPDLLSASVSRCRNIASVRAASLRASGLRAVEMLSRTKEIPGVQGAKSESDGKYDSGALLIARMPKAVQAMKNNPVLPSDPKSRTESMRARRLFLDIESVEIDEMKANDGFDFDDKPKNCNKEDDALRAICSNNGEQMAMVGNKEDDKRRTIVVNKEDGGPNERLKNEKDDILRKRAPDAVNSHQFKSIELQELGQGKKALPYSVSAGLSYLDSQEPGEQSQADALNMVDKLVWINTTGFSQDPEPQKFAAMTFSGPPSASGPQNLVQLVESKGPKEKIGVFDWIDSQNDEAGGQFLSKNSQGVVASPNKGDKIKSESKWLGHGSYKSKNGSSVLHEKIEKIGKDKSKILLQGLRKVASSGASESNLTKASNLSLERQNKVKGVKDRETNVTTSNRANKSRFAAEALRFSERLRPGKQQNNDKKKTDGSDKKNSIVEKPPLNSGEACDQQVRKSPTCNDYLDLFNVGNHTQLAAEAMHIMHSETSPNRAIEENTCTVAKRGRTKLGESRKRNSLISGTGVHKASEDHASRKRALADTDHEGSENCVKQRKSTRNSLATQEKTRRVHWAEDEGKLQMEDEGRKCGRLRESKLDEKKNLESKTDPMDSEVRKENEEIWSEDEGKLQKEDKGRKYGRPRKSKQDQKKKLESKTDPIDSDARKENEEIWSEDEGKLQKEDKGRKCGRLRKSKKDEKKKLESKTDPIDSDVRKENEEIWLEDEGKLQKEDKGRKCGRPRKSKQDDKKKLESKTDPIDSEARKENEDMVKDSLKVPTRKGSIVKETLKQARGDAPVGRLTRQIRNLNEGELRETETSSKSFGADEKGGILEDFSKVIQRKKKLATDDLTKSAVVYSVGEAKEGMQPNASTLVIHSTRQINRKNVLKRKPETQSDSKIPMTKEEEDDVSNSAAKIVRSKRKQANVEDKTYKQKNSTITQLSKSQQTKEVKSTCADAEETRLRVGEVAMTSSPQVKNLLQEENIKLDEQTVFMSPETDDKNIDILPDIAKAVRRKRSKTNREENKLSKSISAGEGSYADSADRDLLQNVGETALRITRRSMHNSGRESGSPISALTAVDGDKSELNNMVPESGAHGRKSRRRNIAQTTPSGSKLANHGALASPNKDEVQLNGTSVAVRSPFTYQSPETVNFKSPAISGDGCKTTQSSCKELLKKGTPKSTLKRELGRLVTPESGQSPILKDSARKRREPGSIRVLFSHSLDDDITKQQKKILTKLGGQPTASAVDCTHFVTDKFVRTRNMLEAMAAGKLVITHLWLENCGQACYFIDEKKYILRDEKKEKEIGFSMPASLASAQQKPLLQGKRVFVTPSTKPEQESIISMVKAADGQVLNSLKGALSKKEENMESVIVISCEEDYGVCIPLLEKGARIYSPEFLLNGFVVQRLDFSRDQLFTDHVKRTRSTNMHLRQQT